MEMMLNLPVKGKWLLLFSCCFLIFFLAYKLNIKRAAQAIIAYHQLSKSAEQWKDSDTATISSAAIEPLPAQSESSVLNCVSRYADEKGIAIEELAQRYDDDDTGSVETNKMVIRGTYTQLLGLVDYAERLNLRAAVCSADWELKSENGTDKAPVLLLTMYIKKLKHE